jgi:hypothetical protein
MKGENNMSEKEKNYINRQLKKSILASLYRNKLINAATYEKTTKAVELRASR